jgi:hypothetical protein
VTFGRSRGCGRLDRFAFRQDGIFAELKSAVENELSKAGLMLFTQLGRLCVKRFEMIRKIEIERFGLTTSKAFNEVIAGVNAAMWLGF